MDTLIGRKSWRGVIRQDGYTVHIRDHRHHPMRVTRPDACQLVAQAWQQLALARLANMAGAILPKGRVPRRIEEMVRDADR